MRKLMDQDDLRIYSEAINGDIRRAYRLWYRYYLNIDELSEKQEMVALAGWNPSAISGRSISYDELFQITTLLPVGAVRSGKTLAVVTGILFQMWLLPDLGCLNVGPSVDQAATMYRMALNLIFSGPHRRFEKFVQRPDGGDGIQKHPFPKLFLWNGSSIDFRSSGYECELIRGNDYDRINADECQLFREAGIRTLQSRIVGQPVAGHRRMGIMSLSGSPLGTLPWLRRMFDAGDVTNPHRNPRMLSIPFSIFDNIKNLGAKQVEDLLKAYEGLPQLIEQELKGKFVDDMSHPFPNFQSAFLQSFDESGWVAKLEEMIAKTRGGAPYDSEMQEFALPPEPDHVYLSSWDFGKGWTQRSKGIEDLMGRRGATIGLVLDITNKPWKIVAYRYMIRNYQWSQIIGLVRDWKIMYDCQVVADRTGIGDPIDEWADSLGVEFDFPITLTGSTTSGDRVAKPHILNCLQLAFTQGWIKSPYLKFPYEQVNHYVPGDDQMPQDFVMTLAGAVWHAYQREKLAYQLDITRLTRMPMPSLYRTRALPMQRSLPRSRS